MLHDQHPKSNLKFASSFSSILESLSSGKYAMLSLLLQTSIKAVTRRKRTGVEGVLLVHIIIAMISRMHCSWYGFSSYFFFGSMVDIA